MATLTTNYSFTKTADLPDVKTHNANLDALDTALGNHDITLASHAASIASKATLVTAPATSSSTGVAGQIAYDSTHIYVCVATNTWVRASIATF